MKYNLFASYRVGRCFGGETLTPCVECYLNDTYITEKSTGKIISGGIPSDKAKEAIAYGKRIIARMVAKHPDKYMTREEYLHSEEPREIPNNISRIMAEKEIKRKDLAKKMGVSGYMIKTWADGSYLTDRVIGKLCQALNCEKAQIVDEQYWGELQPYGLRDVVKFHIKEVMDTKGITEQELARAVNILPSIIHKYIFIANHIPIHKLKLIAEVLGCDVRELYEVIM